MKNVRLYAASVAVSLLAVSCGTVSVEEKLVTLLAETICVADQAYQSIENLHVAGSGAMIAQQKMQEAAERLDVLRKQSFATERDLQAAQDSIEDKKALTQKAITLAQSKCSPSETTIEQVTSDINS